MGASVVQSELIGNRKGVKSGGLITTLVLMGLSVGSCGGGSSSGGADGTANDNAQAVAVEAGVYHELDKLAVTLKWRFPVTRLNGDALAPEEVRGHVIIYFSERELDNSPGTIGERIGTIETFRLNSEDIGQFIANTDLAEIVVTGLPNAILVLAPQTSYRLEGLDQDTYYFAISAYDWLDLYSPLSETVKLVW